MRAVPGERLKAIIEEKPLPFWPIHDDITWSKKPRLDRLQSREGDSKIARVPVLIGSNADEGSLFAFGQPEAVQKEFGLASFQCPAAIVAEESQHVGIPTWRYYFNASFANTQHFPGSGAYHSAEINLIFGTFPSNGATTRQRQLGAKLQTAWADFAKNPQRGPGWTNVPKIATFNSDEGLDLVTVSKTDEIDRGCLKYRILYSLIGLLQRR